MGNLIQNDEEIIVLVNYIVYTNNTNTFSSIEKNDLSKIPWLNSSGLKKVTNKNQSQETSNDLPKIIDNNNKDKADETINIKTIEQSDNTKGKKIIFFDFIFFFKKIFKKY